MNKYNSKRTTLLLSILKKKYQQAFLPKERIEMKTICEGMKSVLIIAPHPDDEVIGCGGCIQFLRSINCNVDVLFCTQESHKSISYQKEADTKHRRKEAEMAALNLNYNISFFDGAECLLHEKEQYLNLKGYLCNYINLREYTTVFLPNSIDIHSDHRICFECIKELFMDHKITIYSQSIFMYEVWGPLICPNTYFSLTKEQYNKKLETLEYYRTQFASVDYKFLIEKVDKYRKERFCLPEVSEYFEKIDIISFSETVNRDKKK